MEPEFIENLVTIVGREGVREDVIERICYSRDMSVHEGLPEVIVFVQNAQQVVEIIKLANEYKIPVVPRGAGSSVTGAVIPCMGGAVLDLSRMNRIIEVNKEDRYAVVEPGVVCQTLNNALAPDYFFPPDPGSSAICTLGGMVSTNASGLRALKYGTTKDYVQALEVVLASGERVRTGTKAPKTSAGYDLTRLFVNSEGTLGVITEITLRIAPMPEYNAFAVALFKRIDDAGKAASKILASGIPLCACEIMDSISLRVVREAMGLELPEVEGMLIMEVDGHREAVKEQIKSITDICSSAGGFDIRWSDDPRERGKIWAARAGLVSALSRYKEGYRLIPISEDFGVPVSKIPEAIKETQKISKKHDIIIAAFGHVGDGNLHTTFIIDVRNPLEWKKVKVVGQELIELAIRLGGTVTAEHGTGIARARFIKRELGNAHELMRKIKRSLDPNNILNPGKMGLRGRIPDILDYFAFADLIEKPGEVRSFSKFIDNEILACIQCGFCRAACPVFEQKAIESTNARGKVLLGYSLLTNRAEPSDALAERFYQCTTCMNCTQQCPAGIKVVDIVERLRAELVGKGFIPPEHKQIRENILQFHNPFGESAAPRVELQRLSLAGR